MQDAGHRTTPPLAETALRGPGLQLFALSFLALSLELLLIRWVPSAIRLVAYFANLMLISSFLGLGLGALISSRRLRLFQWFPVILAVDIGFIFICKSELPGSSIEVRFHQAAPTFLNHALLVGIFIFNVLVFVPLGERIGQLFHALPALRAYSWDLGGSLCGTLAFGAFSLLAFSPLWGMVCVAALYLVVSRGKGVLWAASGLAVAIAFLSLVDEPGALWSPYYYITAQEMREDGSATDPANPPEGVRTMTDPPTYLVRVNQDFYQPHGTMNPDRYSPGSWGGERAAGTRDQYFLPYVVKPGPRRVAVVGAGGGQDVEAALLNGAEQVDAVEIDPELVALSRRVNASGVYDDPRVRVVVDDARAFLRRTEERYDLIVFGYLDSQALFSSMSNIRLDGYVYTVESIRTAFERLNDDGAIALSFLAGDKVELIDRLIRMVREATGRKPICYFGNGPVTLLSFKNPPDNVPDEFGPWRRFLGEPPAGPIPTDDWPYLYMSRRGIPTDYLLVIGTLLVLSVVAVLGLMPRGAGFAEVHFFFMGVGFLLLQTRSISTCSLYFGATWMVTTVIIIGVLLMVLLANYVVLHHLRSFSRRLYIPLLISLAVVYLIPTNLILSLPLAGRVAWSMLGVPLPIFFAGLIFSTTFRSSPNPSAAFGANLIGATIGGFLEYLGMAIGHQALGLIVMGAYVASFIFVGRGAHTGRAGGASPLNS